MKCLFIYSQKVLIKKNDFLREKYFLRFLNKNISWREFDFQKKNEQRTDKG